MIMMGGTQDSMHSRMERKLHNSTFMGEVRRDCVPSAIITVAWCEHRVVSEVGIADPCAAAICV